VPFDLVLDEVERTLLISGPNTGGKTVLLKTVGLVVALAQSGCVPPIGAGTTLPVMHGFFVDIGDHQSLAADLSTFSAHVATLRRILDLADASTLILLDEIGSGTDPAEGGALAMAVLETLTARAALTLATTHLGSLKLLATRVSGVVNGSLEFDAATLSPTYRFSKGVPGRSYGLAIARRLGVNETVLAAAEALVPEADRELDQLLAAVEARRQALERSEAALADRLALVERREAVVAATGANQQERETTLRGQEKEAARDRARQAKAYLLEARKQVEAALAAARGAADQVAARDARRLVEDAIRTESERLDAGDAGPIGGSELEVGSRVRLSTGATGDLAELRSDGKAVVLVGAMRLIVSAASLMPLLDAAPAPRHQPAAIATADQSDRPARYELDLRGMRADEAAAAVTAAIDAAVMSDQPHLAIIHGMGTGVLRDTVRDLLVADGRVASFEYAPRQQGGVGVTVATFH
jgi:DNA mismatch repair protein MutS2